MTEKTRKIRFIDENSTKELQKDWQGYVKSQALFGIVVLMIFLLAFVCDNPKVIAPFTAMRYN